MGPHLCVVSTGKVSFRFRRLVCWPEEMTEEKPEFSWFLTGLCKRRSGKSGLTLKPGEEPVYKEVRGTVRWISRQRIKTHCS